MFGPAVTVAVALTAIAGTCPLVAQQAAAPVSELSALRQILEATGFTGSVLVYDLRKERYSAVGRDDVDRGRIPASTFKILTALAVLDSGLVPDCRATIKWDGVQRERADLNRDLDFATAFRLSAVPHFQALVRDLGLERMQHYVDACDYGNRDLSGGIDRFWLSGGLRISPRDQVRFLVRLYRSELPFSERAMGTVRGILESERTSSFVLRTKTGWAVSANGHHVGWWVGWVERGPDVHFFASVIESPEDVRSFGPARTDVPRAVLRALGILDPEA